MRYWPVFLLPLWIVSCDTAREQPEKFVPARPVTEIMGDTAAGVAEGAWQATQAPLVDLNLKREEIPPRLEAILENPYALSVGVSCAMVREEIAALDTLLGPDVCTPGSPTGEASHQGEYVEEGAGYAREHAVGIVSEELDVIPFRSVVRRISGASKHAKKREKAYEAGRLRRAFLKGVLQQMQPGCAGGR